MKAVSLPKKRHDLVSSVEHYWMRPPGSLHLKPLLEKRENSRHTENLESFSLTPIWQNSLVAKPTLLNQFYGCVRGDSVQRNEERQLHFPQFVYVYISIYNFFFNYSWWRRVYVAVGWLKWFLSGMSFTELNNLWSKQKDSKKNLLLCLEFAFHC